jgi:cytochrome b
MSTTGRTPTVPVWDRLVRVTHWGLAASILVAWITRTGSPVIHDWSGYAALAFALLRIAWGFSGQDHARFASFVRAPRPTLTYAWLLLRGREPHHLGHNPLGGWMIVALLALALGASLSGWLYTTDAYWGVEWVERLHHVLADLLMVCVLLHLAGVVFTSLRQRENLVAAMLHGHKRARDGSDAP